MKNLTRFVLAAVCAGNALAFVQPVRAGVVPVIQNATSFTAQDLDFIFRIERVIPVAIRSALAIAGQSVLATLQGGTPNQQAYAAILLGNASQTNINDVLNSLIGSGLSANSATNLINASIGLFAAPVSNATPQSLPVSMQDTPDVVKGNQPIAQVEKLPLVAQRSGIGVDVRKLNQTITAYNSVIDDSSPDVLEKLSRNEDFKAIGNSLRQLRAAIA